MQVAVSASQTCPAIQLDAVVSGFMPEHIADAKAGVNESAIAANASLSFISLPPSWEP